MFHQASSKVFKKNFKRHFSKLTNSDQNFFYQLLFKQLKYYYVNYDQRLKLLKTAEKNIELDLNLRIFNTTLQAYEISY